MREIRELTAGLKAEVAALRKDAVDSKSELASELARARVNADKIKSVTKDLKEANQETEAFLGETGSNFPPSTEEIEETSTAKAALKAIPHNITDINGVTLNQETKE